VADVLALCYHAVSPRWVSELSVTPGRLEAQLRLLLRRGYSGSGFHRAVTAPQGPRTVVVTFDDGYRSVYRHARAPLERLGVVATVFVVTDCVDGAVPMSWPGIEAWGRGPDAGELVPMTWDELGELASAGWEIGSHTATHPHLTQCDDVTLERELRSSRERIEERLQRPCWSLAYPYGDVDERVATAAADAGYVTACTLPDRLHPPSPLLWPRVGVWHSDTDARFRMKVSPGFRRLRGSPAWGMVARAPRTLAGARSR